MVVARDDSDTVKVMLADRFQIAIDEAAMRLGSIDSGSYLEGWRTTDWVESSESASDVVSKISQALEEEFDQDALNQLLDALGTVSEQ